MVHKFQEGGCQISATMHLCTMTIPAEIAVFERRLSAAHIPLARVFVKARINRSTWHRWRDGTVEPGLKKWRAVQTAIDALTNAPPPGRKAERGAAAGA